MAEMVESSSSSPDIPDQKPNQEEGEFDPITMRRSKPGLKRLILTFSVLFSFLLGFPFLWKSIEIYRAPLPFKDIDSLSERTQSNPLQFPCNFRAIFVGFDSLSSDKLSYLQFSISDQMAKLASKTPQCGTCSSKFSVSVTIESNAGCFQGEDVKHSASYQCGAISAIDFGAEDGITDDKLESALGDSSGSGGKVYSVVIVNRDANVRAVIGKYKHAWIVGMLSEASLVSRVSEIFVKIFMNGGKEEGVIQGEFMPVGADGSIVLSFNLLNADPQDWVYDWDLDKMDDSFLSPIVQALGPLANITVESQVLYHTPKSSYSYWDDRLQAYIFGAGDLPFFVNSNEWHLDTSIAAGGRSKILHFVVYIPSAKECPLLLQLPNGDISKTKGFISPMWGGVIVWNPPSCLRGAENNLPVRHKMSADDLEMIYEVFLGQLRQLFGLKSENSFDGKAGSATILASDKGFTEWELDVLSRRHACFNLQSCATTLGSLSRLVQSLPRMIIKDEIGKQVELSIEEAKRAETDASLGVFNSSAHSSRQARSLAEDAFFHPSIMSVSYYSFEHCFAVYSPFFLPVALHVVLAALRELKRYKQENNKYLTRKAKANASATS